MNILLSIVIVEYNSIDEITTCVCALKQNIQVPYEIIVSSNSCYNSEQQRLIPHYENVRWVFNERNGGFAYAMNEGLKSAKGKYLVIMNSDCIIHKGMVDMINFMEQHPEVGAIAPKMQDDEGNIQDTARPYVSVPSFMKRQLTRLFLQKVSILNKTMNYNRIQTVDWVIGAFILVSRAAYEATQGLSDDYFMYAEDLDWCTRIRQNGYEIVYFPNMIICYKGTRRARSRITYAMIFMKSHFRYWQRFGFFYGYPKRKIMFYE